MRTLSFGSPTLDDLFFGGIPTGVVFAIFGKHQAGKSMLSSQIAVQTNRPEAEGGLNAPALYIDTEGMLVPGIVNQTVKFFTDYWKLKKEPVFDVIQVRSIEDVCKLFGIEANIQFSEKSSKASAKMKWTSWEGCPVYKGFSEKKYGTLIFDSMTNPLKAAIALETENWSARASLMNLLFGRLQKVSEQFDAAVIITHHSSKNPTSYEREKPFGPSQVLYNSKYILALLKGAQGGATRLARRDRYGFLPPPEKSGEGEATVGLQGQAFV